MAAETKGQEAQDVEMSESGKGPEPAIAQVSRRMTLYLTDYCIERNEAQYHSSKIVEFSTGRGCVFTCVTGPHRCN